EFELSHGGLPSGSGGELLFGLSGNELLNDAVVVERRVRFGRVLEDRLARRGRFLHARGLANRREAAIAEVLLERLERVAADARARVVERREDAPDLHRVVKKRI